MWSCVCGTDLVQTLAPEVAQGLLEAEGQGLTRALHLHNQRHSKHILVLIVGHLHPLHELGHCPDRGKHRIRSAHWGLIKPPTNGL